ncbi:restriction endonuclease subunit S [Clostridium sp.]|uniref:restriction endonuclease subunit S n=1 Tax=Clostridium sp. TaxID=1506 RepID=UPI003217CAA2
MSSKLVAITTLEEAVISSNTGADAIKRAPIVEEDTGIRCLRIGDVSNNKPYIEWGFTSADEKVIEKFSLKKDDIVIARTGNTIGVVKYIDKDTKSVYNNGLIRLKIDKNKFDPKYIYYNLRSKAFKDFVFAISGGTSTQPNMKINHTLKFEIANFKLADQKAISKILSDLDKKIETNNQINKKIEEMAQAIFKQWFVDFEFPNEKGDPYKSSGGEMVDSELGMIPKGWKVSNLEGIIEFNPKETLKKDEECKFIEMAALSNFSSNIQYWIGKNFCSGSKFRNGDTLLARITPCLENGKTAFVDILEEDEVAFGSTEFIVMRANDLSNKYYIYCLAREDNFRAHAIKSMSGSSGRQRVQLDLLKNYKVAKSPQSIYSRFGNLLESLFRKIANNNKETVRLVKIRDTLLPKLMSGEIRVQLE